MSNGNGGGSEPIRPTPVTAWQLIFGVVIAMVTIAMGLWTILSSESANNKAITDKIENNYVTNSRHNDLETRLNREAATLNAEVLRLSKEIAASHETSLPRSDFNTWEKERTRSLDILQKQVDNMTSRIETAIRDRASTESTAALQKQIDELNRTIERLSEREDRRHIRAYTNPGTEK